MMKKKSAVKKHAAIRKSPAKKPAAPQGAGNGASRLIDGRIRELDDWRGQMLAHVRALIQPG